MPEKDIRIRLFRLVQPVIREDIFSRDLSIGSNNQQRGPAKQNQQSQSRIHQNSWYGPSGIAGLTDLEWV